MQQGDGPCECTSFWITVSVSVSLWYQFVVSWLNPFFSGFQRLFSHMGGCPGLASFILFRVTFLLETITSQDRESCLPPLWHLNLVVLLLVASEGGQQVCSGNTEPERMHCGLEAALQTTWSGWPGVLAPAAITQYQRLGGLNDKHLFLIVLAAVRSHLKVLADLVLGEGSLLICRWQPPCCVLTWQGERSRLFTFFQGH